MVAERELEKWALTQAESNFDWEYNGDEEFEGEEEEEYNETSEGLLAYEKSDLSDVVLEEVLVPPKPTNCLVMIRHGKTEHNKLGLFTGWVRNWSIA